LDAYLAWDEIEKCRCACFPNVSKLDAQKRFALWGGIPRYVLLKTDVESQKKLRTAINSADPETIMNHVGETHSMSDTSHKLLHVLVDPNTFIRQRDCMTFASPFVQKKLAARWMKSERDKLARFLSHESPLTGSLRGQLFEGFAHERLMAGGTFDVRCLTDDRKEQLELGNKPAPQGGVNRKADDDDNDDDEDDDEEDEKNPELNEDELDLGHVFRDLSEIKDIPSGVYAYPSWRTLAAVDSVVSPDKLFQMTVAERHGIKVEGLKDLLHQLPKRKMYRLYFVVPSEHYESFQAQSFVEKKEPKKKGEPKKEPNKRGSKKGKVQKEAQGKQLQVEQWVLRLEYHV